MTKIYSFDVLARASFDIEAESRDEAYRIIEGVLESQDPTIRIYEGDVSDPDDVIEGVVELIEDLKLTHVDGRPA